MSLSTLQVIQTYRHLNYTERTLEIITELARYWECSCQKLNWVVCVTLLKYLEKHRTCLSFRISFPWNVLCNWSNIFLYSLYVQCGFPLQQRQNTKTKCLVGKSTWLYPFCWTETDFQKNGVLERTNFSMPRGRGGEFPLRGKGNIWQTNAF